MADENLFHSWWDRTVDDANRLFQTSFDNGTSAPLGTVLGDAFRRSRQLFLQGRKSGVVLLSQIYHLLQNLNIIEEKQPSSFDRYKARLVGVSANSFWLREYTALFH